MPVLNIHLVEGRSTPEQHEELVTEGTRIYCEVLEAPIERVRAFITLHPSRAWATAGKLVSDGGEDAPFFTAIVFADRSNEQTHRLMAEFTDLLVKVLDVSRDTVRGQIIRVQPDDWAIAGVPASTVRAAELKARAEAAGG